MAEINDFSIGEDYVLRNGELVLTPEFLQEETRERVTYLHPILVFFGEIILSDTMIQFYFPNWEINQHILLAEQNKINNNLLS